MNWTDCFLGDVPHRSYVWPNYTGLDHHFFMELFFMKEFIFFDILFIFLCSILVMHNITIHGSSHSRLCRKYFLYSLFKFCICPFIYLEKLRHHCLCSQFFLLLVALRWTTPGWAMVCPVFEMMDIYVFIFL